jgi:hypothetical protein
MRVKIKYHFILTTTVGALFKANEGVLIGLERLLGLLE